MELDGLPSTVMPPPAVTLTFDLLIPKANQHIYEPTCICDQGWMKFLSLVLRYCVHKLFGSLPAAVTLTFDLLTSKANQHMVHICEPKYICCHDLVKFPSFVFEILCSRGVRDAQNHSLTDGQT